MYTVECPEILVVTTYEELCCSIRWNLINEKKQCHLTQNGNVFTSIAKIYYIHNLLANKLVSLHRPGGLLV